MAGCILSIHDGGSHRRRVTSDSGAVGRPVDRSEAALRLTTNQDQNDEGIGGRLAVEKLLVADELVKYGQAAGIERSSGEPGTRRVRTGSIR